MGLAGTLTPRGVADVDGAVKVAALGGSHVVVELGQRGVPSEAEEHHAHLG